MPSWFEDTLMLMEIFGGLKPRPTNDQRMSCRSAFMPSKFVDTLLLIFDGLKDQPTKDKRELCHVGRHSCKIKIKQISILHLTYIRDIK